jgi:hypothetical protein
MVLWAGIERMPKNRREDSHSMKNGYWIVTVLLCLLLLLAGYMDITHKPALVAAIASLGHPEYFLTIDGVFKFLAVLGLLVPVPGLGFLKEWAYAGLVFLTIGASWSHLERQQNPLPGVVGLALTLISYALWKRTLANVPKA